MKKALIPAICILIGASQVWANPQPNAAKIDKICYKEAFKNKPATVTEKRFAYNDYARCMEKAIKERLRMQMPTEKAKEMDSYLEKLAENYQKFYWDLYNPEKECSDGDGNEQHLQHLKHYRELLKDILKDVSKAKAN